MGECKKVCCVREEGNSVYLEAIVAFYCGFTMT